jgi:hypothetical protein
LKLLSFNYPNVYNVHMHGAFLTFSLCD